MSKYGDITYRRGVDVVSYSSNISRTATSAAEMFPIPAYSRIKFMTIEGAKSDAGTSGRLSIGSNGGGGKDFLADFNVKTNGVFSVPSSFNQAAVDSPNVTFVTATYAEDGGASTVGGPWTITFYI